MAPPWPKRRITGKRSLEQVAIVGGTHGNEMTGVLVAKHFQKNPELVMRPSFKTTVMLSNTAAVAANQRYVETDMNRCFLLDDLQNEKLQTLEHKRAREIDALLGPKASEEPTMDLVLDLHNTTANTGVLLLMAPQDDFAHLVAAHIQKSDPEVRICEWSDKQDWPLLPTTGRSGMTVEVGPIAHGTSEASWFQKTKEHVCRGLDYVHLYNTALAATPEDPKRAREPEETVVEVFQLLGTQDYPRDEAGDLAGLIHPELQGNDFKEIKHGDPAFLMHDGAVVPFDATQFKTESKELYTFFVNEAAYYEKKIAFSIATKVTRKIVSPVSVN